MKNKTDLVIVTNEPFPVGMAATNRILSYAKEISKKRNVTILIAKPTELPNDIKNIEPAGNISLLKYKYIHNKTIWPKDSPKFVKAIIIIRSYILLTIELICLKSKSVLLVSNDIKLIWFLWFLSKLLHFNYYQEKSEKPPVLKRKVHNFYKKLYLYSYRLFSGIIVMTKELKELFMSLKQENIFHLPMTVEIDRFEIQDKSEEKNKFIFKYCGGGNYLRDGLHNMINAFIELKNFHQNFELHIIGPVNKDSKYLNEITQTVKENNANNFIYFIGNKNSNEIPALLMEADFLVMTPHENFSSGGFPTKLGEFLATGKPVICTSVSEIPLYLNENNSILIEPNNHDILLSTLKNVLLDSRKYSERGKHGRLTVEKHFTMSNYTNDLIKFLKI